MLWMMEEIPYTKPSIESGDIQAVLKTLTSPQITRGKHVQAFEDAVAQVCSANYAVAFSSGSAALSAATFAAKVRPKEMVTTTPNTFIATVAPSLQIGARLHFLDIDRTTGNLNINAPIKGHFFPVHFGGIAIDMQKRTHQGGCIIEDGAHALGSKYPCGNKVGSCTYSDMTIFSFHPAKIITSGEGGIVTTNDAKVFARLKTFRNNGITRDTKNFWDYDVTDATGNTHMTDIHAALALSQLERLSSFIIKRRKLVAYYRDKLKHIPHIRLFTDAFDTISAFHLFVIQIDFKACNTSRENVMHALKNQGITTALHYKPLYRLSLIEKKMPHLEKTFPEMEAYFQSALTLPLYVDLTEKMIDAIVEKLLLAIGKR